MNLLSKVSDVLGYLSFVATRRVARKKVLYILTATLLFASCTTTSVTRFGADFDKTKSDLIVKGKTTKQEIVQLLGQPFDKTLTEAGAEKWIYLYRVTEITTTTGKTIPESEGTVNEKKLEIFFDQDVVKNFVLSESVRPYSRK